MEKNLRNQNKNASPLAIASDALLVKGNPRIVWGFGKGLPKNLERETPFAAELEYLVASQMDGHVHLLFQTALNVALDAGDVALGLDHTTMIDRFPAKYTSGDGMRGCS